MCLAVPAEIVARQGDTAVADMHGNRGTVSTALVPEAGVLKNLTPHRRAALNHGTIKSPVSWSTRVISHVNSFSCNCRPMIQLSRWIR